MIREIKGNLLDSNETYIIHQCNCVTTRASGIALDIFKMFPYANTYKSRISRKSKPGTVQIRGNGYTQRYVVNLYGQRYPSKSKFPNDTPEMRINWFKSCLVKLRDLIQPHESIAFPYGIGCGQGGGDWNKYREVITQVFSKTQHEIFIYKLNQ